MNRALSLDVAHYLLHRVLQRYRDHHVHVPEGNRDRLSICYTRAVAVSRRIKAADRDRLSICYTLSSDNTNWQLCCGPRPPLDLLQ